MKKDDHYHRNKQEINEPMFEDASYQDDMRVDPLTTMEAIKKELSQIDEAKQKRDYESEEQKRLEEAQNLKEFEEFKAEKLLKAEKTKDEEV